MGGVGARRTDVGADPLRADEQPGPPLDRHPLQGVVAVRGPDPVGARQHPKVHPRPATGTGLDLERPGADAAARRGAGRRPGSGPPTAGRSAPDASVRTASCRSRLWSHLRNAIGYSARRVSTPRARTRRRPGLARSRTRWWREGGGRPGVRAEHPVGTGPGEVGVVVDHLRLDPEAEVHPRLVTWATSGSRPCGSTSGATDQSPRARGSSRRPAEAAVVEDERSTPIAAAASARRQGRRGPARSRPLPRC